MRLDHQRMAGALFITLALALPTRSAADEPLLEIRNEDGVTFLSGGIGQRERRAIARQASDFNVELAFTGGQGYELGKVDVSISDRDGNTVLDTKTRGPLLLVNLPRGEYLVHASVAGRQPGRADLSVQAGQRIDKIVELPVRSG